MGGVSMDTKRFSQPSAGHVRIFAGTQGSFSVWTQPCTGNTPGAPLTAGHGLALALYGPWELAPSLHRLEVGSAASYLICSHCSISTSAQHGSQHD